MKIKQFEDIIAWQNAKELSVLVYRFYYKKNFGLKNQIRRASLSIMNNIAKGFEHKSKMEFVYFLYVAKGTYSEVPSMLILSKATHKISDEDYNHLFPQAEKISMTLSEIINKNNPFLIF